jgi:hypothetical protein
LFQCDSMAFDAEPGGDPRGPWCPKCGQTILAGQPRTIIYSAEHPDFRRWSQGRPWHGACAWPHLDTLSGVLEKLQSFPR